MSTTRPRVEARYEEPSNTGSHIFGPTYTTPGVLVEVTFDLHDHDAALAALDRAVADVRAQIEETRQEDA